MQKIIPPSMTLGTESGVDEATKLESTSRMRFNVASLVSRMVTASKTEWVKFILDILCHCWFYEKQESCSAYAELINNQLLHPYFDSGTHGL